ncbi:MAG TPA: hypothetical protein VIS96_18670 [Terrimicrobiaceae bacterium]
MATACTPGPLGIDLLSDAATDEQIGDGITGPGAGFGLPGPIGLQSPGKAPGKGGGTSTKEINIVGGGFDWDPPISETEEIAKLNGNLWSPGTKDFVAVVNSVKSSAVVAGDFGGFLGAIVTSAPGSIKRINLITHANPDIIAFSGKIVSTATVNRDVRMDINANGSTMVSLDVQSIKAIAAPGVFFQLPSNPKKFFVKDIRDKFASDATVVLYACHSGLLTSFIQDIADFFKTTVVGFTTDIAFCPPTQSDPKKFNRSGMQLGIGSCASKVQDFRTLISDPRAVTRSPTP